MLMQTPCGVYVVLLDSGRSGLVYDVVRLVYILYLPVPRVLLVFVAHSFAEMTG